MAKTESTDSLEVKHRLIDKAREQVTDGAHYLWSAAGATPGGADGAPYRPRAVKLQENVPDLTGDIKQVLPKGMPFAPTLFTAWADTGDGEIVCTGRAGVASVQEWPLAIDMEVRDALRLTLKKLKPDQIDELKNNARNPAVYRWPRKVTPRNIAPGDISTVWGESCVDTRHFDCIGLVNYCYSWALNQTWDYSIDNFVSGRAGATSISLTQAAAGDIVTVNSDHIGIVTFEKTAIEARDANSGLVESGLNGGSWTNCYRLPASTWRHGPS